MNPALFEGGLPLNFCIQAGLWRGSSGFCIQARFFNIPNFLSKLGGRCFQAENELFHATFFHISNLSKFDLPHVQIRI